MTIFRDKLIAAVAGVVALFASWGVSTALAFGQGLTARYDAVTASGISAVAVAETVDTHLDGVELHFDQGAMGWGAPVEGKPTALVFAGKGWFTVPLPNSTERQQVKLFTGRDALRVSFTAAVFRFSDATALRRALGDQARFKPDETRATQLEAILAGREAETRATGADTPIRILDGLSDPSPAPWSRELLLAQFQRADGTWVHVDVDPLAREPLQVYALATKAVPVAVGAIVDAYHQRIWDNCEPLPPPRPPAPRYSPLRRYPHTLDTGFRDTWTAFAPAGVGTAPAPWSTTGYDFAVTLRNSPGFAASEALMMTAITGHRGILLRLSGKFRAQKVTADGAALAFLQAPDPRPGCGAKYNGNWLYTEWPAALKPGDTVRLTIEVENPKAFITGSSVALHAWIWPDQTWYPMNPFGGATPRAHFQMEVQRSGKVTRRTIRTAHWGADAKPAQAMTGFGFEVTGPINGKVRYKDNPALDEVALPGGGKLQLEGVPHIYNMADTYDGKMRHAMMDAFAFYSAAFGNLPLSSIGFVTREPVIRRAPVTNRYITGFPGEFGNLPSFRPVPAPFSGLMFRDAPSLPGLMLVWDSWAIEALNGYSPGNRDPYGVLRPSRRQLFEITPAHVVAHQWWNDWVGWSSRQDSWLGEALANGSASIFEAHEFGSASAGDVRAGWMQELTTKDIFGRMPNALGPLCLGPRLASSLDPAGYDLLAQDKGGYVIEMLRAMMGETRFRAAMHDLTSHYGNRNISVTEFEQLMAVHMSPAMELDHNGSLAWFFDEYVRHRTIPKLDVSWTQSGKGVQVHVANPEHWRGLLPIYFFQDAQHARRALVPVNGTDAQAQLQVEFTPVRIAVDPWHEMLVQIEVVEL